MVQQPKTRQEAEMLGMPKWQIDQMFPEEKQGGLLGQILGSGLLEPPEMQAKIDHYAAMPVEPEDKRGFWQGGDKITGRDAVAGLLAGVGDGLQNYYGGDGNAMQYLQAGRLNAAEMAREKAAEQAKMQQTMAILQQAYPNLSDAQRLAIATGNGNYSDFKQPQPTGTTRLIDESANWTEDQWRRFGVLNPVQGGDGRYYPRVIPNQDAPDFIPDEEMGGAASNGGGTFRRY